MHSRGILVLVVLHIYIYHIKVIYISNYSVITKLPSILYFLPPRKFLWTSHKAAAAFQHFELHLTLPNHYI